MERHDTSSFYNDSERTSTSREGSMEEELRFGYGWYASYLARKSSTSRCTPSWLQWMHNSKWLLLWLGCIAFIQSFVVNAIFPVDLSTLEKQFSMTSTHTGIISSWYDFAVLLVVFPICHWGRTAHKGRWIGLGGLVMAVGSLVCALPHFLIAPYDPSKIHAANESDKGQCSADYGSSRSHDAPDCSKPSPSAYLNPYFLLFLLGQTLHGFGSTPLYSIGTAYIDENVSQTASPLYLAIHGVITAFGPVIGLFAGGFLLRIYVDFDRVDHIPLQRRDARWLGAWWIGFLISAVAVLFASIPILGFAKELPEAKAHRAKDVDQAHSSSAEVARQLEEKGEDEKESLGATLAIVGGMLRNQTFVIVMIIGIAESVIVNGFSAFMPKILETVLSVSPTIGSYMSSVVIFAAATGLLTGGWVIRKLKLQVGGMFKMTIVCEVLALLFLCNFLIRCPPRQFAGINIGYDLDPMSKAELDSTCNAGCACDSEWNPVCDPETSIMFYSACRAGCKRKTSGSDSMNDWEDCACVAYSNTTFNPQKQLMSGYCSIDCGHNIYFFMGLLFLAVVVTFASAVPTQQIMLRVVPFDQRTLAIGVNWTFLRLLGFIPGGILFGWIIDKSCVHWESKCGHSTNCLVYDPHKQAFIILALAVVCKLVSILACIFGYITYTPTEADKASMATVNSHGALSLMVNDDRRPEEQLREIRY